MLVTRVAQRLSSTAVFEAMIRPTPALAASLLLGCALAATAADLTPGATATTPLTLDYLGALDRAQQQSPKLAAARAAADGRALQAEALRGLGGPSVSVGAAVARYRLGTSIDPGALLPSSSGLLGNSPLAAGLASAASRLPSAEVEQSGTRSGASVSAVWPLYTGGAIQGAQGLAAARRQEAEADWLAAGDDLDALLTERYFSAQLAAIAAGLRAQAARTAGEHDHAAARMLQEGVIARVDRLQASTALRDAQRQASAAQSDAELAAVALARTVGAGQPVRPSTPLFVLTQPVEPLAHFFDLAMAHHPGLAKVAAKRTQAEQLHAAQQGLRGPQVLALASSQLRDRPNWAAGVAVSWTLWSSIDRDQLSRATLKDIEQADLTDAQARSDIQLLVERQWRAVDNARRQFMAFDAHLAEGDELLRLRRAGLREGTSTALALIDAETRQAQRRTERAQIAYQYTQALAGLLHASGQPRDITRYLARPDAVFIKPTDAPAP